MFKSELRHCVKRTNTPMPDSFVGCVVKSKSCARIWDEWYGISNVRLSQSLILQVKFVDKLSLAHRLLEQKQDDENKLYSLHASVVECIVKGKAHKRNEFGVKVNITLTNRRNFLVGQMVFSGNPYDGHTLKRALEQMRRLSQKQIDEIFVDRDYRGHGESLRRI